MVKFSSLNGNTQKLDGGAMFGNAPRTVWEKWIQPDESNRITLACRCLLVETDSMKLLIETGIGAYMEPKLMNRFGVEPKHHLLLDSLQELSLTHEDITHVLLSHLHFDHAGGLLNAFTENSQNSLLFPNAQFLVGHEQWQRASSPHLRDRASYIPGLNQLLPQSSRLKIIQESQNLELPELTVSFFVSHGHTPGLLCPIIRTDQGTVIFTADLIPGCSWVHTPITMGYDRFPEKLIDEKEQLLQMAQKEGAHLFFTHDPEFAWIKVEKNDSGRYIPAHKTTHFTRVSLSE